MKIKYIIIKKIDVFFDYQHVIKKNIEKMEHHFIRNPKLERINNIIIII